MGGQYEDKVEVAPQKQARGDEEVTVKGIRFHESKGHVHFHDDKAGLKCYVPKAVWWREWNRIRNPSAKSQQVVEFADFENESFLSVVAENQKDSVKVAMEISKFTPPSTYDRVWHALDTFTNRSGG